jgi:hypothetical protein
MEASCKGSGSRDAGDWPRLPPHAPEVHRGRDVDGRRRQRPLVALVVNVKVVAPWVVGQELAVVALDTQLWPSCTHASNGARWPHELQSHVNPNPNPLDLELRSTFLSLWLHGRGGAS